MPTYPSCGGVGEGASWKTSPSAPLFNWRDVWPNVSSPARCRAWVLQVGLAALAVLIPPLLEAQANPPALFAIQITGEPGSYTIRKDLGSTEFLFTVSFRCYTAQGAYGSCEGTPFADNDIDVAIEETSAGRYPGGWSVDVGETAFTLKAKEQKTIPVTVRLLNNNPEEPGFSIELTATSRPVAPNGALDPLLNEQLEQQTTAASSVKVDARLTFGEEVTAFTRSYMWWLLGASVVLLVGAVVLVQRKRGSIELASASPVQDVAPGRGASFPVEVINDSKERDRIHLGVSDLPSEWTAVVPLSEIDLAPNERTQLWITVRAPARATAGQVVNFEVHASSVTHVNREARLPLQATVSGAPPSPPVDVPTPPPLEDVPPVLDLEEDVEAYSPPARPEPKKARRR